MSTILKNGFSERLHIVNILLILESTKLQELLEFRENPEKKARIGF